MSNNKSQTFTPAPKQTSAPAPTDAPVVTQTPEPTQEATQAPVQTPEPTNAPVIMNSQQANVTTLESTIEAILQSDNTPGKFVIAGLQRYIDGMKPGMPITKNDVVMHQVALWQTLYNFVENTQDDFNKIYSTVLGLFFKHKDGVFHEHYVFRMMSDVTLDKEESTAFLVFVNLLKVTADPVGRQDALKQNVDISRTLASVFSENARQKILAFYGM